MQQPDGITGVHTLEWGITPLIAPCSLDSMLVEEYQDIIVHRTHWTMCSRHHTPVLAERNEIVQVVFCLYWESLALI